MSNLLDSGRFRSSSATTDRFRREQERRRRCQPVLVPFPSMNVVESRSNQNCLNTAGDRPAAGTPLLGGPNLRSVRRARQEPGFRPIPRRPMFLLSDLNGGGLLTHLLIGVVLIAVILALAFWLAAYYYGGGQ